MKKVIKFFGLILICLILISSFVSTLGADVLSQMKPDWTALDDRGLADNFVGLLRWVGYAIAVGVMVVIGVKYIQASADEKADLKSAFPKYLIGAVLIIFAVEIVGMVFSTVMGAGGS